MSEGTERIRELVEQASNLPREDGNTVTLLEEAVRIADTLGDAELGFSVRMRLVDAGCWSGHLDRMIVAFAWCLARYDLSPDKGAMFSLYWKYKWIAEEAVNFPHIGREKINELYDDMASRYAKADISLRPVHYFRCRFAMVRGDKGAAARHFAAWIATPRDYFSNCSACEADERVDYHAFMGDDDTAVRSAEPMLQGKVSCAEVPHRTFARVLLPLLRLGRLDEAAAAHRKGIRLIKPGKKLLEFAGEHVAFLALTGNHGRAVKQLERFLPFALEVRARLDGMSFLIDALLLTSLLTASGTTTLRLKLPKSAFGPSTGVVAQKGSRYEVAALHDYLAREAAASAAMFDRRNGTSFATDRIQRSLARAAIALDFPLDRGEEA